MTVQSAIFWHHLHIRGDEQVSGSDAATKSHQGPTRVEHHTMCLSSPCKQRPHRTNPAQWLTFDSQPKGDFFATLLFLVTSWSVPNDQQLSEKLLLINSCIHGFSFVWLLTWASRQPGFSQPVQVQVANAPMCASCSSRLVDGLVTMTLMILMTVTMMASILQRSHCY